MTAHLENFPLTFWGEDKSTSARFEISDVLPPIDQITSCFVLPIYRGRIVMVKAPRGWGFPGGHREVSEQPEDCIRREALEEASIELGSLTLIGYWKAIKEFDSPFNQKYPPIAYQLFYLSEVSSLLPFVGIYETKERALITPEELKKIHQNYDSIEYIMKFVYDNYLLS